MDLLVYVFPGLIGVGTLCLLGSPVALGLSRLEEWRPERAHLRRLASVLLFTAIPLFIPAAVLVLQVCFDGIGPCD